MSAAESERRAPSDALCCRDLAPDAGGICTRERGHEGDHIAHLLSGAEFRRWPQLTALAGAPQ